ncbi:MAG: DNA cytosine methyltransferase [Cyanobacteria bacterium SBLK]|nr:DNA cytosine methyltransferase [Cyanobacteria bacterium SBLK]
MHGKPWTVIDLFSGVGGMSYGFHVLPNFKIVGAVDAQIAKPSGNRGALQCNRSYQANMGLEPIDADLFQLKPVELRNIVKSHLIEDRLTILISCPPCTGFSRVIPNNHSVDDPRNSLVTRNLLFVEEFQPAIFLMENARELIKGKFSCYYERLRDKLTQWGYKIHEKIHFFNHYGLPQKRERALILAVKDKLCLRTLSDLWEGYSIQKEATYVRRAISVLPPVYAGQSDSRDPLHIAPKFTRNQSIQRLQSIPHNGGSWADLKDHPNAKNLLTPAMLRYIAKGDLGSHPDVYGRLWWDKPAATIKRECAHIGNGRYAHPEQDRLCTIREMSILQGFPQHYKLIASSRANIYRQIGDAVPPLISYQIARLCEWILTNKKPSIESVILPNTHLRLEDLTKV